MFNDSISYFIFLKFNYVRCVHKILRLYYQKFVKKFGSGESYSLTCVTSIIVPKGVFAFANSKI